MILNIQSQLGQLHSLVIRQTRSTTSLNRNLPLHRQARLTVRPMLDTLRHNILVDNVERTLVNNETVRIHMARDQCLAKPPSSLNHNLRRIPVDGVNSERDA